jgi:hypothetical protein
MIGIEQHRHKPLPLELSLPDQPAEANDFRKSFVAGKGADDFAIPTFARLRREGGLELRQFLLDSMQSCFQSMSVTRHGVIISHDPLEGKSQANSASAERRERAQ